ncbi:MAG: AtpZ/AtpI family protein [Chloroflexi bacterium]|jgi:F0F1-type ATP synthase assembly protein I|nr:AtpZ/AtpI family protein [Chloroflexota bacterium]
MIGDQDKQDAPAKGGGLSRAIGLASELGVAMGLLSAAMLLGSLALGRWLDRVASSTPVFTIVMLVVGALAGQATLYRMATNASDQLDGGARHAVNGQALRCAIGLALQLLALTALPAVAGAGIGLWLDHLLQSAVLFTILLTLVGFGLGMVLTIRAVQRHRSRQGSV